MKHDLKILAIIGARSGSRGVPNKNIRPLFGKPLLAWIILTAQSSQYINRIMVCTDSPEYAAIAREYGAEVPYLQPKEISTDTSTDLDFMTYAVDWLEKNEGYKPDWIVHLYAPNPLQRVEDIDACIELVVSDPEAHSAVAMAEAHQHPHKAVKISSDGKHVITYTTESSLDVTPLQRQSYERAYFRQGNVMVTKYDVLKVMRSLSGHRVRYHIIPKEHAVDIDSELDFLIVEQLMKNKHAGSV